MKTPLSAALCTVALLALFAPLAGCQTPNRGTSTVETSDEPTEPNQQQDRAPQQRDERAAPSAGLEQDVDRPGSDYREVALDEADPIACKEICDRQMRCMAFTYVRPDDGRGARCRLKHSIPDKVEGQDCCVSGVNPRAERRIAQLEAQGFELDTDRPGHDFRSFEMDRPEPSVCKEACDNLMDCQAFTYVRPGYDGENAQCHLKEQVSEPVGDHDCCISGLK